MKLSRPENRTRLWLVLSILSATSMAWYVIAIWSANQPPQFSDLYASWWASHEVFLHGRNPYSPAVAHEIQRVIYGQQLSSTPEDPGGIGGGFAYPLYTTFLLWPTVHFSFRVAKVLFLCVFAAVSFSSLECWMRVLGFRPPPVLWLATVIFAIGSFPSLESAKLQNLSVIAAAFIAFAVLLLSLGQNRCAGVVLALSTFKPQFTIVLIPWLVLWTAADWRRRRSLAWGFLGAMFVLMLSSEWLVPGWIGDFVRVVRAYGHYTYGHSLLDVWLGSTLGTVAGLALLVLALILCWPLRFAPANSPRFVLACSVVLAATDVVIPTLAPHVQLLLLPGFLCMLCGSFFGPTRSSWLQIVGGAAWILLVWPWLAAFILLMAAVRYGASTLFRFWEVPLYSSAVLPLAVVLVLAGLARSIRSRGEVIPAGEDGRSLIKPLP